jgi:hypothetical protein
MEGEKVGGGWRRYLQLYSHQLKNQCNECWPCNRRRISLMMDVVSKIEKQKFLM